MQPAARSSANARTVRAPHALLRVGISSRALFDLEEEHGVFSSSGLDAYLQLQAGREGRVGLAQGAGFDVVRRLLSLNVAGREPFVEVVLLSRNAPDQSLRIFEAIAHHGLAIRNGSFTGGRPLGGMAKAWDLDLFLSNEADDVRTASEEGVAAARLFAKVRAKTSGGRDELRIALDGDSVVFGGESDAIFANEGLDAFLRHEALNASTPMREGPFARFLKVVCALREATCAESRPRIALVTSRSAPAHVRVVRTLRAWGTPADEAHFVGTADKTPVLEAFGTHIFFDDREEHVGAASSKMAAALVPKGRVDA